MHVYCIPRHHVLVLKLCPLSPRLQISEACQDLLSRMLTADPAQRITVAGIMAHPWFTHDLPPGTLDVNTQLQQTDTEKCGAPLSFSSLGDGCISVLPAQLLAKPSDLTYN